MNSVNDVILPFMRDELGIDTDALSGDSPLFSAGIIDSFSLVSLLAALEDRYQFRIRPTDVNLDNFDTLNRMALYLESTLATTS